MHLDQKIRPLLESGRNWFADIEFNKKGYGPKILHKSGDRTPVVVRPDIIIHDRQDDPLRSNFLIVECKKATASNSEKDKDRDKITAFIEDKDYQYNFGLQVIYDSGRVKDAAFFYRESNTAIKDDQFLDMLAASLHERTQRDPIGANLRTRLDDLKSGKDKGLTFEGTFGEHA